jgi:hypothetical protein
MPIAKFLTLIFVTCAVVPRVNGLPLIDNSNQTGEFDKKLSHLLNFFKTVI